MVSLLRRILLRACATVLLAFSAFACIGMLVAPPPLLGASVIILFASGLSICGAWWFWKAANKGGSMKKHAIPAVRVAAAVSGSRAGTISPVTQVSPVVHEERPTISEKATAALKRIRAASLVPSQGVSDDARQRIRGSFAIEYDDAYGNTTHRVVDAHELEVKGDHTYLRGYCHLRQEMRTFRCDRVFQLVDSETGEVVDDEVGQWLQKKELGST